MITNNTTATLSATIAELKRALSWMPLTSTAVTSKTISTAGRLITAPDATKCPVVASNSIGGPMSAGAKCQSNVAITCWKYEDQLLATVAAPTAYSSTRSQPMIHANSSPSVA